MSWLDWLFGNDAQADPVPETNGPTTDSGASGTFCSRIPSGDLASAIERDPELGPYNEAVQAQLDQFKTEYSAKLKEANPACGEPNIIDVPDLFVGKTAIQNGKVVPAEGNGYDGGSLFSNPTNDLQIGQTVLLPDPGNENFRSSIGEKLRGLGITPDYLDTYFAHSQQGNLHCSTNAIRYCRPAAASAAPVRQGVRAR